MTQAQVWSASSQEVSVHDLGPKEEDPPTVLTVPEPSVYLGVPVWGPGTRTHSHVRNLGPESQRTRVPVGIPAQGAVGSSVGLACPTSALASSPLSCKKYALNLFPHRPSCF